MGDDGGDRRVKEVGERSLYVAEPEDAYMAAPSAKRPSTAREHLDFRVFGNPEPWEDLLRQKIRAGGSARILSTYSRAWKTEKAADPHALTPALMDFHEPCGSAGKKRYWSRIWNFVPHGGDYTWYVTAHPAGRIAQDSLCEVGCPYAVRGFDYDYVGIIWLNDLVWRASRWQADPAAVAERGIKDLAAAARSERRKGHDGPANAELLERIAQAYRILFTRALKGVYVRIPDPPRMRMW